MSNGIIIKALSGFYYVKDRESLDTYECRARGKFRKDDFSPLVGDYVEYSATENGKGVVDEIMPRKNSLVRPPVANIDKLFVVAAAAEPAPNTFVIDKMIMNAENNKIEPIIVVNKCDLSPDFENFANIYRKCGFCVICVSAATGEGIDSLKGEISGNVCAFAGNTGVGKSSIINALEPTLTLSTGEISDKLGRGRHTTRHIQLYSAAGGYIADTPGFSSFDMDKCGFVHKDNVQFCFREFEPYITKCKFTSCSHTKEKGCAIIDAVNRGEIPKSRFESYCRFYQESAAVPDWQLK
ncbi:MAG: ribosome small subunit-dependent GTPase A [Acutalibacteraceae bacterium]